MTRRSAILSPGVYELEGGVPLGPAIPPGYVGPPPPIPQVQTIEPTRGWWRNAGAFGQRFQGRPPDRENELIPLFEQLNLPGPPKPWWLHWFRFDRNLASEAGGIGNWEFRARVIYGVGGVQNIIETDLMQGMQYPVVCNSISVQLKTYAPYADGPYTVAASAKVIAGCMLGGGAGSANVPPTFTTQFHLCPIASDLVFVTPVPDFARSVCLHTNQIDQADLANVLLTFETGDGVAIKQIVASQVFSQLTQEKGIAIPAGTNQIILFAPFASNAGFVFGLQFFLAL